MKAHSTLPLLVLAGSDRRPAPMPEKVDGFHPLSGYKAVDVRIGGVPLIDLLLERLQASGLFAPLFVVGPQRVYGARRGPAAVIDTDRSLGENIRAALAVTRRQCPAGPVAFTTCDILPEPVELERLMEDYFRHQPMDFWFPLIRAPERIEQLGASAWKPEYRIAPGPDQEPVRMLPGHLVVVDPDAIRLPLVYRSFNLAYRTRNRPVLARLGPILSHVFGGLLLQDLRNLLALRLPTVTATVVYHGVVLSLRLRRGVTTTEEMARRLRYIFVRHPHRRRFPERRGRLPLAAALSLAKDIDTEEEADEMARRLE